MRRWAPQTTPLEARSRRWPIDAGMATDDYRRVKAFQQQISSAERFVGVDLPLPMHVWYTH